MSTDEKLPRYSSQQFPILRVTDSPSRRLQKVTEVELEHHIIRCLSYKPSTRLNIIKYLNSQGLRVHPNSISEVLQNLQKEGVIQFKRPLWHTISGKPDNYIQLREFIFKEELNIAMRLNKERLILMPILQFKSLEEAQVSLDYLLERLQPHLKCKADKE